MVVPGCGFLWLLLVVAVRGCWWLFLVVAGRGCLWLFLVVAVGGYRWCRFLVVAVCGCWWLFLVVAVCGCFWLWLFRGPRLYKGMPRAGGEFSIDLFNNYPASFCHCALRRARVPGTKVRKPEAWLRQRDIQGPGGEFLIDLLNNSPVSFRWRILAAFPQ